MATTLVALAEKIKGTLIGDGAVVVTGAATLETAGPQEVTLVDATDKLHLLPRSRAAAAVVPRGSGPLDRPTIEVDDVHATFAELILFHRPPRREARIGISPLASVDPSAELGEDVDVHPFATVGPGAVISRGATIHSGARIGAGCRIGEGTTIHPNAVLYDDTVVGSRGIVHSNAVLGSYGFGYRVADGGYRLSAQLGWVEIGDDVEIGAGTTIDRGTYGPTSIGRGTKIDNLVQIAHNCRIGPDNMICSQVGVAGSTSTGEWVVMAGQCGVRDHVHLGDRAILGARSGVSNDVPAKMTVLGEPAIELRERKLQLATISKLPEMRKAIKSLDERVAAVERASAGKPAEAA